MKDATQQQSAATQVEPKQSERQAFVALVLEATPADQQDAMKKRCSKMSSKQIEALLEKLTAPATSPTPTPTPTPAPVAPVQAGPVGVPTPPAASPVPAIPTPKEPTPKLPSPVASPVAPPAASPAVPAPATPAAPKQESKPSTPPAVRKQAKQAAKPSKPAAVAHPETTVPDSVQPAAQPAEEAKPVSTPPVQAAQPKHDWQIGDTAEWTNKDNSVTSGVLISLVDGLVGVLVLPGDPRPVHVGLPRLRLVAAVKLPKNVKPLEKPAKKDKQEPAAPVPAAQQEEAPKKIERKRLLDTAAKEEPKQASTPRLKLLPEVAAAIPMPINPHRVPADSRIVDPAAYNGNISPLMQVTGKTEKEKRHPYRLGDTDRVENITRTIARSRTSARSDGKVWVLAPDVDPSTVPTPRIPKVGAELQAALASGRMKDEEFMKRREQKRREREEAAKAEKTTAPESKKHRSKADKEEKGEKHARKHKHEWEGIGMRAVLRYCGAQGWTEEQIKGIAKECGLKPREYTVRKQMAKGKHGKGVPELTQKLSAKLASYAKSIKSAPASKQAEDKGEAKPKASKGEAKLSRTERRAARKAARKAERAAAKAKAEAPKGKKGGRKTLKK